MKRAFDCLAVLLSAPLWLPILGLVALISLCVQGGPVLFTQTRAGRNAVPFRLYKLRTMRTGTGTDEERLTRFGRFLRQTSLDELPQLFNVLKGEMSLVGPRPLPMIYVPRYSPEQRHRLDVLPGLTGLAQIKGRNALTWDEKFAYDLEYVRRHSFAFDCLILIKTVLAVLFHRGINASAHETMPEFNPSAAKPRANTRTQA